MEKKVITNIGVLSVFLLLVSLASAYGVGGKFSTEDPMKLYPGQELQTSLELQNGIPTDGNVTFNATITDSANGMVRFAYEDNIYFVPNGARVAVPLIVSVPATVQPGQNYTLRFNFKQIGSSNQAGTVTVMGGMDYYIRVMIVGSVNQNSFYEAPPVATPEITSNNTLWYVLIGILVVVVILVWSMSKKKN